MRLARFFLYLCLGCLFIHIGRRAIISFVGVDVTYGFSLLGFGALVLATMRYHRTMVEPMPLGFGVHVAIFVVVTGLLSLVGFLRGHLIQHIVHDVWAYLFIAACLIVGRSNAFWTDLRKPMLIFFWVGFVILWVSLGRPMVEIEYTGVSTGDIVREGEVRSKVWTLGYDLQAYLSFWPVLFVLAYQERKWTWQRFLGLATAPAYLILQIMFLKRAPTIRAIGYVIVAILASAVFQRRLRPGTAVLAGAGLIVGVSLFGGIYLEQLKSRFERSETESRFYEARSLLSELSGIEWVVGRGMGGYFVPPAGWKAGLTYVDYKGTRGRTAMHVGILMPMLKGGITLTAIFYLFFFRAFTPKPPGWVQLPANFAARAVFPVYLAFLFIEGPPLMGDPMTCLMIGICCARASVSVQTSDLENQSALGEFSDDELQGELARAGRAY